MYANVVDVSVVFLWLLHIATLLNNDIYFCLTLSRRYGVTIVGGELSLVCWPTGEIEDDIASMPSIVFRDV